MRVLRFGLWELMPRDALQPRGDVNSKTANGDTPLMIVPDINVALGTPLHIALDLRDVGVIDALMNRRDLDINSFRRNNLALTNTFVTAMNLDTVDTILKREDLLPRFFRPPYPSLENEVLILLEDIYIMTHRGLHDFPLIIKALAQDCWTRGQRDKRGLLLELGLGLVVGVGILNWGCILNSTCSSSRRAWIVKWRMNMTTPSNIMQQADVFKHLHGCGADFTADPTYKHQTLLFRRHQCWRYRNSQGSLWTRMGPMTSIS
ncbi:hypothetical protein B0H67DRAFT_655241 [Lasiosphaeris hirsuta]|uniref:Uncharacterized protein n=1 Tax=Lasiosphaeris hirsuta TaxID=260670 RepID=A0AA40BD98_9PEZI|nr:hypothetical protein B0H67DRAFT_655241 [Lasiosphaeris hirsuta]